MIVHLIHHCDMNTAMKRQPQVGPRKYKRRRKLKPHELEIMSNVPEGEDKIDNDEHYSDSDAEMKRRPVPKKVKKTPPKAIDETYAEVYNSFSSAIENINSIVNSKAAAKNKKKSKNEQSVPSRPKMIHTQKTRVPVETNDGGKVRHKTKTLVTRTQPTELKSATGERIRPRTKNVSYHIFNADKPQIATFPEDDIAVNNLLATDMNHHEQSNGDTLMNNMDIGSEQVVESEIPVPTNIIKV